MVHLLSIALIIRIYERWKKITLIEALSHFQELKYPSVQETRISRIEIFTGFHA